MTRVVEHDTALAHAKAPRSRWRRWARWVGLGALLVLAGGALGWAGARVFAPPAEVLPEDEYSLVAVSQGEVGSSLSLDAAAEWQTRPAALNAASGTITSVDVDEGAEVDAGTQLYSVNLRPVIVAQGEIPSFGSIAPGDTGAGVGQLQSFLASQGYWSGGVTNEYPALMRQSVEAWQRDAGFPADGTVQAGDIVWLPSLPARVTLESAVIARGLVVTAGAGEISVLDDTPSFVVPMQAQQTQSAPTGTTVLVQAPEGDVWEAIVDTQVPVDDSPGVIDVSLTAPDGGSVCGDSCGQIDSVGQTLLPVEVQTVPAQSGLTLPAAAILTGAAGDTFVFDAAGARIPVDVVASARGIALVEGLEEGLEVRVPASASDDGGAP